MAKNKKPFRRNSPNNKRVEIPERIEKLNARHKKRVAHIEVADDMHNQKKWVKLDLKKIYRLCILGMSVGEIAEHYDIKYETFTQYLNPNAPRFKPELAECVAAGTTDVAARVAGRLVDRAMGFKHKSEKIFYDSQTGQVVRAPHTVQYPPSEQAAMFILKNKRPQNWKDKQVIEQEGAGQTFAPVVNVITSDDKIKKLMEDMKAAEETKSKKK